MSAKIDNIINKDGEIILPRTVVEGIEYPSKGVTLASELQRFENHLNSNLQVEETYHIGTNSYIKFKDGTLYQVKAVNWRGTITQEWGSMFTSPSIELGDWLVPFTAIPYLNVTVNTGSSVFVSSVQSASATSAGRVYLIRPDAVETETSFNVHISGFFRWK